MAWDPVCALAEWNEQMTALGRVVAAIPRITEQVRLPEQWQDDEPCQERAVP
jgi:hypothetical protein